MAGALGSKRGTAELEPSIDVYAGAVRRFLARRARAGAELDDLVQEVFARLFRREAAGPLENREGYLFQIAANLLRERGRREVVRREARSLDVDPALFDSREEFSPERILLGREACDAAVSALRELPDRTRTVFVLSRFEDMTGPEIAARLRVSVSTVEKDMMRAIAHLRTRLS